MADATQPDGGDADWRDRTFDLTRGIAAYSGSRLVGGLARVVAKHPEANISNAFNHKQVACKMWARDRLFDSLGGTFRHAAILGGWYGVLAAMLLEDPRFSIGTLESIDIDPAVAVVAETLNRGANGRFRAVTADMYAIDYARLGADLVVNTSCEHIADLREWLDLLPKGHQRAAAVERLFQRAEPHQLRRIGRGFRRVGRSRRSAFLRHPADEEIQSLHADRAGVSASE